MKILKCFFCVMAGIIACTSDAQTAQNNSLFGQQPAMAPNFSGMADPAMGYSAWVLQNNENSFQRMGGYRVRGTPYLFGGTYHGDVYAKGQLGKNVIVGFDTYHQQLEIYLGGKDPILKPLNEVDSFTLKADSNAYFKEDMRFVNAQQFDSTKKVFLLEVYKGHRFSLFKYYYSKLGIVSQNYVQSELRQFDLNVEYYYYDHQAGKLTKMKLSPKFLKNQFGQHVNVSSLLDLEGLNRNPQMELLKIFTELNK